MDRETGGGEQDITGSQRAAAAARFSARQRADPTPVQVKKAKPWDPAAMPDPDRPPADSTIDFDIYSIKEFRAAIAGGDAQTFADQYVKGGVTVASYPDFFDDLSENFEGETAIYFGSDYWGNKGFGAVVDTYQDAFGREIILKPGENPPFIDTGEVDELGNPIMEPADLTSQFMLADGAIQQAAQTIDDGIEFASRLLEAGSADARQALINATQSLLDQREAQQFQAEGQRFDVEQQQTGIEADIARDEASVQASIDLEQLRTQNRLAEDRAAQEGRDAAQRVQNEWNEAQAVIASDLQKERDLFLKAVEDARFFADRGVEDGDFDAVAVAVKEERRLERAIFGFDIMKQIVANPQMLSIMTAGGFWDQLEEMAGINLGGLKALGEAQASQTLGGQNLPTLRAFQTLDAAQQDAMLFNLSASSGISREVILQEIHRRAGGRGLATGAGGQGAQGILRLPAGT